mmetsp:Transcript_62707/g.141556  ORF Transcript_62707/g.141556 Transcript_62707/m.141556 type:complete len:248 (-) Transcript_62707:108-851(-)
MEVSDAVDFDAPCERSVSAGEPERPLTARSAAPKWDEASGLFWCATNVNAYELPDGREWHRTFQELVGRNAPQKTTRRRLQVHVSDAPTPLLPRAETVGRRLARFPSDPDKRQLRAAHTAALMQMPYKVGVERWVQGRRVGFCRLDGHVFAFDARCPHQGGNLCEGEIGDIEDMVDGRRSYITCPVHKMQFDLATGDVLEGSCPSLQVYKVRIPEADDVQRVAMIEVGFESLTWDYFLGGEDLDVDM